MELIRRVVDSKKYYFGAASPEELGSFFVLSKATFLMKVFLCQLAVSLNFLLLDRKQVLY